ncbi:MAG: hypothetical protein ABSB24_10090 [Gaiellaceae bacterium]
MLSSRRVIAAVAAGLMLVLLPLGGGALGATSSGAPGDVAFVRSGSIYSVNTGTVILSGAVDPSWSPDGTMLAFSAGGSIETCTVSSCGSTTSAALDSGTEPVWSPDGSKIAYVKSNQIWTVASGGGTPQQVTTSGTSADPSWSFDGSQLVITYNGAIATVSASGGTPSAVTTTGISSSSRPAWSPDGSSIAFQSSSSGHSQIYVVPDAGGTPTQVTGASPSSFATDEETAPSWSPDSTSIVYADSAHGIQDVTKGGTGAWGTPSTRDGNTADTTPDWQTVAPLAVASPSISGGLAPQSGQVLSTTNGTWNGANTGGFSYAWQRCDASGNNCSAIGVATASTYAVASADVGDTLRSVVTASNAAGSTASSPSSATGVVTLAGSVTPPVNTVYPTITLPTGETAPMLGDTLFASAGTWSGAFPMTFTYQWTRCEPADPLNSPCFTVPGATASFFTVPASLYGSRIRVRITATNAAGAVSQSSASTGIVGAIAPSLSVTPPIVGKNVVDQTLSVDTGTWLGSTPLTFTFEWRRCNPPGDLSSCTPIAGATKRTYVPTTADIGFTLRVYITATNPAGSAVGITNHIFPVIDRQHFGPSVLSQPSISGTVGLGLKLTADTGSFSGDTPIATSLAWQRCDATGSDCHSIRGATQTTYTPTRADFGSTLRVVVTATNAYGTFLAPSVETAPVSVPWPHLRGKRIVGTVQSDYLVGTPQDDVIYGGRGNDTIQGNGGYDTIYGGPGNDVIAVTGPGGSRVYGGPGSDTIYAAGGFQDFIDCGPGQDRAYVDSFDTTKNCEIVTVSGATSSGSGSGSGSGGSTSP